MNNLEYLHSNDLIPERIWNQLYSDKTAEQILIEHREKMYTTFVEPEEEINISVERK